MTHLLASLQSSMMILAYLTNMQYDKQSVPTSTSISTSKQSGFTVLYSPYTHTSNTSYSTSSLLPDEPTAKKQKSTASTSTSSSSSYTATTAAAPTTATALHQ